MNLTDQQLDAIKDFKKFAERFLVIKDKAGHPCPFRLNQAQSYIHERIQRQKDMTGIVRAVILKGRQQGCSTYIQARFFHQVITSKGKKAFILTHDKDATKNLFDMAFRYYENLPKGFCPVADTANAKELYFREFDSGYAVGTAGNKAVGRSQTIQLFHGCLAEGSMIIDPSTGGLRSIEKFSVNDFVLTHNGCLSPISFISSQEKECLEVILRGLTAFPLLATPNHRFWTKKGWKKLENFDSDEVIGYPVKKIKSLHDKFLLPEAPMRAHGGGRQFVCPNSIKINYKLGRLFGLYLAEGHIKLQRVGIKNPSSISFIVHRKELGRTVKWVSSFHKYFSSIKTEDRENCLTSVVTVYGNRFAMLVNNLCGRTIGKHLPLNWHQFGEEFCRGLLHGYISGDGHSEDSCRRIRASSICSAITIPLRDLAASLGYGWASIEFKQGGIRNGRHEKDRYIFSLCGNGASYLAEEIGKITPKIVNKKTISNKPYAAVCTEISDGYAWLRISSIRDAGKKQVYDFEVEHEDHSYCTIHGATHNSEVGYWAFADEHSKGILQAVSSEPGTEIILESTANGIGNYFHERWLQALDADSDWQAIFLPWYWQDEYTRDATNMNLSEEEEHYMSLYASNGLTKENLSWRRVKLSEFSKDIDDAIDKFNVEYPFTAQEAFKNPISRILINGKYVAKARQNEIEPIGKLIIGVDVAIGERDQTAIIRRKGRCAYNLERKGNMNTMEIVAWVKRIITKENPHKVYIDGIGIGAGVVDRLNEMGFDCVEGVNVAKNANQKEIYKNIRAELWWEMREWLYQDMDVQIPDEDALHGELCSLGYEELKSTGQIQIESKEDLRSRGMPSPDGADALALTFMGGFQGQQTPIEVPKLAPWERGMFR